MDVTQTQVELLKALPDGLPFGEGLIGRNHQLHDHEAQLHFAGELANHTRLLTQHNLADCGDSRKIVRLLEAKEDSVLIERVVSQLFGGTFLSATKVAVAADIKLVQDAKTFQGAFESVAEVLTAQGEEDTVHDDCGADKNVEKSVATKIDAPTFFTSMYLLANAGERGMSLIRANLQTKRGRLLDGFYGKWDPQWHMDYVASQFPHNVAFLDIDYSDQTTHGHREEAIYVIEQEGHGFAKNSFVEDTDGRQAFAVTIPKMRDLANKLGGSNEEKERLFLGFIDDTLHVSNVLAAKHIQVFTGTKGSEGFTNDPLHGTLVS